MPAISRYTQTFIAPSAKSRVMVSKKGKLETMNLSKDATKFWTVPKLKKSVKNTVCASFTVAPRKCDADQGSTTKSRQPIRSDGSRRA
uniref:Uncharacterized protein n=1 Tax=Bursaphelenchus xylophilus TaxID=6326 RepID=A0A1I7S1G1_BURXY